MTLTIRFDLDYVPWRSDTHREPAIVIRLLAMAREMGLKYHFFISTETAHHFPTMPDQMLNEGHDVDWLAVGDEDPEGAVTAFGWLGHTIVGRVLAEPARKSDHSWDFVLEPSGIPDWDQLDHQLKRNEPIDLACSVTWIAQNNSQLDRLRRFFQAALESKYTLKTYRSR